MPSELDPLVDDVKAAWHRFLDVFEPLRPELYRYCRHLTRSAWDAEDLVQDAMARAFVTLGTMFSELPHPRAWVFKVASNLWLDRVRRARRELALDVSEASTEDTEAQALREAAGTLIVRLSPQERAAIVLKEAFALSLEEIAIVLSTTVGAVKAALHRGRERLTQSVEPDTKAAPPAVLEAFARAFNARDLEGLTALLLESASVEIVGVVTEYGPESAKDPRTGSLAVSMGPLTYDDRGGLPERLRIGDRGLAPRCEARVLDGVPLLLFWYEHDDGPYVRCVMTLEIDGTHVARVRNYFFSPDVLREVCSALGVPFRVSGYRFW